MVGKNSFHGDLICDTVGLTKDYIQASRTEDTTSGTAKFRQVQAHDQRSILWIFKKMFHLVQVGCESVFPGEQKLEMNWRL